MSASGRISVVVLVYLSNFCLSTFCLSSVASAQQSDQVVAERVLGPQWKQLSRRAGMIFACTVVTPGAQTAAVDRPFPAAISGAFPSVELSFRIDEAIAGVEQGQILTVHEWAGAWSMHRPMREGQHILIFLYPTSRLGLTSPVGGSLGQVALDPSGKNVSYNAQNPAADISAQNTSSLRPRATVDTGSVSVIQLERAIRSARGEKQ